MKKIIKLLPALMVLGLFIFTPESVDAQGFVPCSGETCSFCHFIALGQNVLNWIFGIVFVIFGVVAVAAGFGLTTSGGNQAKLDEAKKKLSNAFVGLIIVFSAWLIVDTLLKAAVTDGNVGKAIGTSGVGMWNEISCGVGGQNTPTTPAPGPSSTSGPSASGPSASCGGCVTVPGGVPTGGSCASGSCYVLPFMSSTLPGLHSAIQSAGVSGGQVVSANPPGPADNDASCLAFGSCIKYGKPGGFTAAEINATVAAAQANGYSYVYYQVSTPAEEAALISAGVNPTYVTSNPETTAPAFVMYGDGAPSGG